MSSSEWREVKLGVVCEVKGGKRLPKGSELIKVKNNHPYIRIRDMYQVKNIELNDDFEYVDDETYEKIKRYIVNANDVIVAIVGNTIGLVSKIGKTLDGANLTENCVKLINLDGCISDFIYYHLISQRGQAEIMKGIVGTSQPKLPIYNVQNIAVSLPNLPEQKAIAATLSCLDDKIELNNRMNKNLEEMAQAIFKSWFVDFEPFQEGEFEESELGMIPKGWRVGKAEDFFEISIGKTPPRKESKWFSTNKNDVKWVSISDMGKSGTYILNTSEYLTDEAIKKHNVKIVPSNTIILSFKLTVGRVAITSEEMATNEAIAHFKTKKKNTNEFLLCYLKSFNYDSLGNTSSIATAVNSKVIKAMTMMMPTESVLNEYYNIVNPLINVIRKNEKENQKLIETRDTLLPKLMSGEIRVPFEEVQ